MSGMNLTSFEAYKRDRILAFILFATHWRWLRRETVGV